MGLLIDTSVLVAAEREYISLPKLAAAWSDESFLIASITASELLHGVYRAGDAGISKRRLAFIDSILRSFPVIAFDLDIARIHASVWADLEAKGQRIGSHDLLIAATALAFDYSVVTLNVRDFQRVPKLKLLEP